MKEEDEGKERCQRVGVILQGGQQGDGREKADDVEKYPRFVDEGGYDGVSTSVMARPPADLGFS